MPPMIRRIYSTDKPSPLNERIPVGRRALAVSLGCLLVLLAGGAAARAQPVSLLGGRLLLAGEASGSIAPDDEGYFNYSDYETNSLRLFRVDLALEATIARFLSLLADARSDNLGRPRLYALYLRVSPWPGRPLDLQAGLVPPVFGAFPRRRYASENPLPSVPLAYQYLTDLRDDAIPTTAEQLLAQRGRGWLLSYPVGASQARPGLPLVNGERWDAGVELRIGRAPLSLAVAVTQGSPSHPLIEDDNGGKQLAGRITWTPGPALTVGISAASGEFLARSVTAALPQSAGRDSRQDAFGADARWSRGPWIVYGEALWSRWTIPALDETRIDSPLSAYAAFVEARYKILAGFYAAARVERLAFSSLASTLGRESWDAPVTRLEAGLGFVPQRHLLLKASWQHNQRDAGHVRRSDLLAAQLVLWF
jgi:hypothetical protein